MKIVATILDGRARVQVAATRAPDLLRRQIAAQTGDALLVAVALAPPGLGPEALVAGIDRHLQAGRLARGLYAVTPAAVARAATRVRLAFLIRSIVTRTRGRVRRGQRRVLGRLRLSRGMKPGGA
jgi:hypothetical protein